MAAPGAPSPLPASAASGLSSASVTAAEDFASGRRRVEVIFSDVDGTLLDEAQRLTPRVARAVNAAAAAGVPLVLATGKALGPWLGDVLPHLRLSLPRIHLQGLAVLEQDGTPLRMVTLERDTALAVLEVAHAHAVSAVVYTPDRIFAERVDAQIGRLAFYGEPRAEAVGDLRAFLAAEGAPKPSKVVILTEEERAAAFRADLAAALGTRVAVTSALPGMVEVLPPGASKGATVLWLLERLGIDPTDAMALGDGENDVEMLRDVGLGIAMGNAAPQPLAVADAQTASNAHDGVALAIERFVLAPRGIAIDVDGGDGGAPPSPA